MKAIVIGDACIDILVPFRNISPEGTNHRNIKLSCGGTANVAVWASRLGSNVGFLGKIGNDPLGELYKKTLMNENVLDYTIIDSLNSTSINISLVDSEGNRTMITNRGANNNLNRFDIIKQKEKILNCNIVFISGYLLQSKSGRKAIKFLLNKLINKNMKIWFNPGAYNIIDIDIYRDLFINKFDVLILNYKEAKSLTNETVENKILSKLKNYAKTILITKGSEGCLAMNGSKTFYIPSKKVENVTDTTGAGDAFAAGLIYGKMKSMAIHESCEIAHNTAAEVIKKIGPI